MQKVSIITVVYNNVTTIESCLQSIVAQDYPNIEYIIVDGSSTDGTLEVINRFKDKISTFVSEPDEGLYHAMNKGIALATGDIIGTLNSDDFYTHSKVISNMINEINKNNSDSCYSDLVYVEPKTYKVTRYWQPNKYNPIRFKSGWMPPHPTFFAKSSLFKNFGDFNTSLINSADYELMLRFLYANKCTSCYVKDVTVAMRTGGHSNISLKNRIRANREDRKSWQINSIQHYPLALYFKFAIKLLQFFKSPPQKFYKPHELRPTHNE